ncbi:hypothetical protein V499_00044 [Pseudogymnoascus sp. VKM F-103]|nr:hypothetical protein V499_00044 [Pseudogymnoascus sp. VKM F-103]
MATVNMNCVEFYNPNPKPALKASHAQLPKSVLNKHRLPLQPSRSPSAMSAWDVRDNDSPLIIEDDSDDESDDEAKAGVASSNLLASIEDQDASECGLATQDTASTTSSLFGPFTPRDSDYLSADCFSKDGQQRPSFVELDSTFPV